MTCERILLANGIILLAVYCISIVIFHDVTHACARADPS
jgi:hypothetical protein